MTHISENWEPDPNTHLEVDSFIIPNSDKKGIRLYQVDNPDRGDGKVVYSLLNADGTLGSVFTMSRHNVTKMRRKTKTISSPPSMRDILISLTHTMNKIVDLLEDIDAHKERFYEEG